MEIVELKAAKREHVGKSGVRKTRAEGKIPAIFYGPGIENLPVEVEAKEFASAIAKSSSMIMRLELEGAKDNPTAIVKAIQREPLKKRPIHIDFMKIAMDEKITANVAISLIGESPGVKEGGVLQHGLRELQVEALPKDLPEHIEVDIGSLLVGDTMRVADLAEFPELLVINDSEEVVCTIVPPTIIREEEIVPEEAEIEGEEPEVIGREEAEEEEEQTEESPS